MKTSKTASSLKIVKVWLLAAVVCALIIGALAHQAQLAGSARVEPVRKYTTVRIGSAHW